ncbi:expressed unknown protein [Seminavis robusta]|uniref:Uncharacterized protein n=1 Tax=Seminavis robusta TaxID=568900 RepID=A0A9N8E5Y2_9STRA|nr:expressed unknown protein [Seminavis robusta]|eukprot:Sro655_g182250.1 n/a (301) ;mRNA; f:24330-25232
MTSMPTAYPHDPCGQVPLQPPTSLVNHGAGQSTWGQYHPVLVSHSSQALLSPDAVANIQTAIEQAGRDNRKGVIAFASGDARTAYVLFRSALEQLECLGPCVHGTAAWNGMPAPANLQALEQSMMNASPPLLEAVPVPAFQDGYIYLYDNVLDFLRDAQRPDSKDRERFASKLSFYCSLVMFNIALAMHKHGIDNNEKESLVSAIHCYDMSMKSISTIRITDYTDKLMLIMLAIWNNQAQIYWSLHCYDHAKEILEGVRRLAARLLLERCPSLDEADQNHIYEFVLNVITVKEPTTAPCA